MNKEGANKQVRLDIDESLFEDADLEELENL